MEIHVLATAPKTLWPGSVGADPKTDLGSWEKSGSVPRPTPSGFSVSATCPGPFQRAEKNSGEGLVVRNWRKAGQIHKPRYYPVNTAENEELWGTGMSPR